MDKDMGKVVRDVLQQTGAPAMGTRLTKEDYAVIRNTFKDNWETLKIIRDLFFGFNLSEFEIKAVQNLSVEAKNVIRKELLPVLSRNIPVGATTDLWMTLHLADKDYLTQVQTMKSRDILIKMLEGALNLLDNPKAKCPLTEFSLPESENDIKPELLMARNTYIVHIEQQLVALHMMAYLKEESPNELATRRAKDGTK